MPETVSETRAQYQESAGERLSASQGARSPKAVAAAMGVRLAIREIGPAPHDGDARATTARLRDAVGQYVEIRRAEGATPERIYVELKEARSFERPYAGLDWRMREEDVLTSRLLEWCLKHYFPLPA